WPPERREGRWRRAGAWRAHPPARARSAWSVSEWKRAAAQSSGPGEITGETTPARLLEHLVDGLLEVGIAELAVDFRRRLPEGGDIDLGDRHALGGHVLLIGVDGLFGRAGGEVAGRQGLFLQRGLHVGGQAVEPAGAGDETGDEVDVARLGH